MPYLPDYQSRLYCPTCGEKHAGTWSTMWEEIKNLPDDDMDRYFCKNGHKWEYPSAGHYSVVAAKTLFKVGKAIGWDNLFK